MAIEAGSLASSRKGMNPRWSVQTALMVSIYRDESAKKRAADNYTWSEQAQEEVNEIKRKARVNQGTKRGDRDNGGRYSTNWVRS